MNAAQEELRRRQFYGIPTYLVEKASHLNERDFSKLGIPMVFHNIGWNRYDCNCRDDSIGEDETCSRCGGHSRHFR